MNANHLADVILQLLPKVSVPLTHQNAETGVLMYKVLGEMSRGELVLVKVSKSQTVEG